jgi:hypothetical protein
LPLNFGVRLFATETKLPIRATIDGENTHAYEYTEDAWAELKESYKTKKLLMPCCQGLSIPKTSKLGTFFFSHKQKAECNSAPESPEHIYLKSLVARAASEAGWLTCTEYRGQSAEGEDWVADVLCIKGNATVAFEIQLSAVPYSDIAERTQRYRRSKVRAAWIVDAKKFKEWKSKSSKSYPIFGVNHFSGAASPNIEHFEKPADEFVKALLSKKVQWIAEPWEYEIHYIEDTCWKCNNSVKQVYGSTIDVYGEFAKTVPNASTVLFDFRKFITNEELIALGLNTIGRHEKLKGNAPGFPYCNVCIHCEAPQNNHYLMEHIQKQDRVPGTAKFVSSRESSGNWVWVKENGEAQSFSTSLTIGSRGQ